MENFKIYKIRCLTNMHVGNGDASYTLIDNEVQRDVITGFPVINSSSLKGSLKSFLNHEIKQEEIIKNIFGDEKEGIGKYKIFSAMLLSIPVRSNVKPFFRAVCPRVINDFLESIENFSYDLKCKEDLKKIKKIADENSNSISILQQFNTDIKEEKVRVEGVDAVVRKVQGLKAKDEIENLFGENIVIIDDKTFSEILDGLPVIARNKLNNGESENLWYEEVVPRETRFYFGVVLGKNYITQFEKITSSPIQIGGNATIGYGYCNIEAI